MTIALSVALASAGCAGNDPGSATEAQQNQGGSGAGSLPACAASPARAATNGRLDIPVRVTSGSAPASIGNAASGQNGREYKLSLFKLFLSQPTLIDAAGRAAPAQFVTADGAPLPYELALVDADDAATQTLRLAAPQGQYVSLSLGVGVPATCNQVSATDRVFPLNVDSDMFWTWGSQFMFIRLEGASRTLDNQDWQPFAFHVGYDPAFTTVSIPAQLTIGASGNGPSLSIDVDRLLACDGALPSGEHVGPDTFITGNLKQQQPLHFE